MGSRDAYIVEAAPMEGQYPMFVEACAPGVIAWGSGWNVRGVALRMYADQARAIAEHQAQMPWFLAVRAVKVDECMVVPHA